MAIYSLSHNPVGRTTHAAGTAGAHARYVTREGAARDILGQHMPTDREAARAWLDAQEAADRKNARVIDKVMLALPVELDEATRSQLVRDFTAEVGGGRIAWLAAIHDRGDDARNPHAHVIFRDRDIETGKRAVGLSEKGSTDRLREIWERVANQALERAGEEARIDRRSLAEQGIAREAGIHVGPNVAAMEERGICPTSRPQLDGERVIDWPGIDQGRTRLDRQREIEAANEEREQERAGGKTGQREAQLRPVAKTTPEPGPHLSEASPTWTVGYSVRLSDGATWGASWRQEPAQDAQQRPQERRNDEAAREVAEIIPEATQRPPQELRREAVSPPVGKAEAERSRLTAVVAAAKERLAALGDRLDAAFQAVRQRYFEKEAKTESPPPPEQKPGPAQQLRRTLDDYRRDWGPDRSGPTR